MGNTILAKGVNHILAKRDNSAWPKGAKLSGFSSFYPFIKVFALGTKSINANTFCNIFAGHRLIVVVMPLFVSFYRLNDTFAWSCFRAFVDEFGISYFLQVFSKLFAASFTTRIALRQMLDAAKQKCFKFM